MSHICIYPMFLSLYLKELKELVDYMFTPLLNNLYIYIKKIYVYQYHYQYHYQKKQEFMS